MGALHKTGRLLHSSPMPSLNTDFIGRVERWPLRPTGPNALMPMFEAVSNSLHAVEDRLGDRAHSVGEVVVEVIRDPHVATASPVIGFCIEDNGVGLDDENYRSFQRPDSRHKKDRGGKGVGRIGWVKVFETIRVDSTFEDGAALRHRSFDFRLSETDQIIEHDGRQGPPSRPGTRVTLTGFTYPFAGKCPVGADLLLRALAAHFLPNILSDQSIAIQVIDGQEVTSLSDFYNGEVRASQSETIKIALDGLEHDFTLKHLRVSKRAKPEHGHNRLFLCAHSRTVSSRSMDNSLGLKFLENGDVYVGCASSQFLDEHVNSERTGFTLPEDELAEIRRRLIPSINAFLAVEVDGQQQAKRQITRGLVQEYPQFLFIHEDVDKFVDELKPGATTKEEVFVEMARARFRRQRTAGNLEQRIKRGGEPDIRAVMDAYSAMVTTDQKGMLAEYVIRRKAVLDMLDTLRGYEDSTEGRQHREDALHSLVCPMKKDSTQLEYRDHNLWLLDDRLAFFAYFNSDKPLKTYTSSGSRDRPDVAFFYDTVSAWTGAGEGSNTVVLVEFKRPNRDDYTGNDNPVRQVGNYVQELRSNASLKDYRGNTKSVRLKDAAYHCYVVADITTSLLREIRDYPLRPTPDGVGYFGYIGGMGQEYYLEIVPYEKLLVDAKMRNAVFFQVAGLTDLDPAAVSSAVRYDQPQPEDPAMADGIVPQLEQLASTQAGVTD